MLNSITISLCCGSIRLTTKPNAGTIKAHACAKASDLPTKPETGNAEKISGATQVMSGGAECAPVHPHVRGVCTCWIRSCLAFVRNTQIVT
jgi:hypothetical protein